MKWAILWMLLIIWGESPPSTRPHTPIRLQVEKADLIVIGALGEWREIVSREKRPSYHSAPTLEREMIIREVLKGDILPGDTLLLQDAPYLVPFEVPVEEYPTTAFVLAFLKKESLGNRVQPLPSGNCIHPVQSGEVSFVKEHIAQLKYIQALPSSPEKDSLLVDWMWKGSPIGHWRWEIVYEVGSLSAWLLQKDQDGNFLPDFKNPPGWKEWMTELRQMLDTLPRPLDSRDQALFRLAQPGFRGWEIGYP